MHPALKTTATLLLCAATLAAAQSRKDSAVIGITLEPPGLDPTTSAAASIGEIVHYNVLEGLTKINVDGSVTPLLADSWSIDPDGRLYTFKLKKGVKFHDGEAFDASDVKFSFERARAEGSTNKAKKTVFDNITRIETPDAQTVMLVLAKADGNLLFRLGENTAVILDPKSAATTATRPIGTGGRLARTIGASGRTAGLALAAATRASCPQKPQPAPKWTCSSGLAAHLVICAISRSR